MTGDRRILYLGDSYVAGVGDPMALGWVGRIAARAAERGLPSTTYKLGVRRDTSADVAARWQIEAACRRADEASMGVVFSFGANDAVLEGGDTRIGAEDSVRNLDRILTEALSRGLAAFVVGPPPVPADTTHAERVIRLEERFSDVCRSLNVAFAGVAAALAASMTWRQQALAFDGAHPGSRGYEQLAEIVLGAGWVEWVRDLEGLQTADTGQPDGSQSLRFGTLMAAQIPAVLELWRQAGLLRPTNDPRRDIERATDGPNSTVLVGTLDGELVATAMVGHDGHRGWVYYLAVDGHCRGRGFGREMMRASETWLSNRGVPKLNLMVRSENTGVHGFYEQLAYVRDDVTVFSRRLE